MKTTKSAERSRKTGTALRVAGVLLGAVSCLVMLGRPWAQAGLIERASEYYFGGRADDALWTYREAVLRSTGSLEGYLNLGILYRDAGRPADAADAFSKAVTLSPGDADVWNALGEAVLQARDTARAQLAFSKALEADSGHFFAKVGSGRALLELGDARLAVQAFMEARKLRPGAAIASYYLGRALESQGVVARAKDTYLEALRKDGQFAEVRLSLGALYRSQDEPNEAWVQYVKAADLDPAHAAAAKASAALILKLTKPPETLIPVVRIGAPGRVVPAPERARTSLLRVAVGTSASGKPLPRKAISVRSGGVFTIERMSDGKRLARARPGEVWVLRKAPHRRAYEAVGPDGKTAAVFQSPVLLRLEDPERDTLIFQAVPSGKGYAWFALKDRELREAVEARPHPAGGLVLVNRIHLEDYLYGIVAEEMPAAWPMEALKAQAVIARTHALYVRSGSPHRPSGFDLCDGQHCQVYGGVSSESGKIREAVDSTRGQVLKIRGNLAQTLYSSNCGGHTQGSEDAGWSPSPSLVAVSDARPGAAFPRTPWEFELWIKREADAYCRSPAYVNPSEYRWTRVVSEEDLSARVNRKSPIGKVLAVRVLERGRSGHVHRLKFIGTRGQWVVSHEGTLRRILGLGPVRSTFFVIEGYRGKDGSVEEFVIHGAGWGHAVGLCQSGAAGLAADGAAYGSILAHYYPRAGLGILEAAKQPVAVKRALSPQSKPLENR